MESSSASTASSELRRSIRHLLAESDYELELGSLLAVIRDDPELVRIAEAELAPRNGHLELHLDGGSVKGHATVAKSFGQFVTRMADATKAAVREMAGLAALPDELLVDAGAGSVRVTFVAPPRHDPAAEISVPEIADEIVPDEDGYSEALRRIAVVLSNAHTASLDDEDLNAAVGLLPSSARHHLRVALDQVHKGAWSIDGEFSQRGVGRVQLHVGESGVGYLREKLTETVTERETREAKGFLDGHTWSKGTMRLLLEPTGETLTASFGSPGVQLEVARLDANPSQRVRVKLDVLITRTLALPDGRRSYVVQEIEPVDEESLFSVEPGSGA